MGNKGSQATLLKLTENQVKFRSLLREVLKSPWFFLSRHLPLKTNAIYRAAIFVILNADS